MRIHREEQDPLRSPGAQIRDRCFRRRIPVSHRQRDASLRIPHSTEPRLQSFCLRLGKAQERRAVLGPDLPIQLRRPSRTPDEDDPVEDEPPQDRIEVDDAPIAEELAKVPPHRGRSGRIRSTELRDQDSDPFSHPARTFPHGRRQTQYIVS